MSDYSHPLQALIKARIQAHPWFSDAASAVPRPVPVLTVDDGDVLNALDQKAKLLNEGLNVLVLVPFGKNTQPEQEVVNPRLIVEVTATEHVKINRGSSGQNKRAYHAVRKIASFRGSGGLHHWIPGAPFARMEFLEFGEFTATNQQNKSYLLYRAMFAVNEAFE